MAAGRSFKEISSESPVRENLPLEKNSGSPLKGKEKTLVGKAVRGRFYGKSDFQKTLSACDAGNIN
jgi:hypothetical protein